MISQHQFIAIDKDTSARALENGMVRDMLNLIPVTNGTSNSGERQNLKGNTGATQTGMTGTNYSCKGVVVDEENSLAYLFCTCAFEGVNSSALLEYDFSATSLTQILILDEGIFLSDTVDFVKGFIESGWIYYNDGDELKQLNIAQAKAGDYDSLSGDFLGVSFSLDPFSLYILAPRLVVSFSKSYDSTVLNNTVGKDSWQFRFRYRFKNGAKSPLTKYQGLTLANKNPYDNSAKNKIAISFTAIEGDILAKFVDKIEFYGIKNNEGVHRFLGEVDYGTDGSGTFNFTNANNSKTLSESEALKPYENISRQPVSIAYPENRMVAVKGLDEYDLSGNYDFSLSVDYYSGSSNGLYAKEGGTYEIGLVFLDAKGRRTPVLKKKQITVPYKDPDGTYAGFGKVHSTRPRINVEFSGTAPSWVDSVVVVSTKEQNYEEYIQVPVNVLFYSAPEAAAVNFGEGDPNFAFLDGNLYVNEQSEANVRLSAGDGTYNSGQDEFQGYTAIDFQLPVNIPVKPEIGWRVRVIESGDNNASDISGGDLYVSDVFTNVVRVEGFDFEDWSSKSPYFFVEFYKPNTVEYNQFYDVGGSTFTDGGGITIDGDTAYVDLTDPEFRFVYKEVTNKPSSTLFDSYLTEQGCILESPTPCVSENDLVDIRNPELTNSGGFNVSEGKRTLTLDYSKKVADIGVANIENTEYSEKNLYNTLIASNSYVENTKINGLNRFDFEDEFSLPNERTPITHLEVVNDVLLALHERNATSVYIGSKFLKQASGQDTVTTTDSFFGDERLLKGGYGTINPESVKRYLGQCFWWDANNGCVVRYSANGLDPISDQGLKDYFRTKAETYSSGYKVFGAIDPYLELYLITFPDQDGLSPETWAWDIKKGYWIGRFSFCFEQSISLGNNFATFKSQNIWKHHSNSVYNNFYNTQYDSRITFVSNPDVALDKSFDNLSLDADEAWDVLSITNPQGQDTDLLEAEFDLVDNQYYAYLKRDKNTASDLLGGQPAILAGDPIQSKYVEITLRKTASDLQKINAIYVGYSPLTGHLLAARE